MKRLAFLLFGHMRSYEITNTSFRRVLGLLNKTYDCDVFIHTWNYMEPETPTWHDGPSKLKNKPISTDEIVSIYNPKTMLIEKQKIKNPNHTVLINQCYEGLKYSTYSRYKANELKKQHEKDTGLKYDVAIMSRPDVIYYTNFLEEELARPEMLWLCQVFCNGAANDIISFSSSSNIDKLCQYHFSYDTILFENNFQNNEGTFNYYIDSLGIDTKVSKYCMPRDWKITRSWWSKDYNPPPEYAHDPMTWSQSAGADEINNNEQYTYFRRKL